MNPGNYCFIHSDSHINEYLNIIIFTLYYEQSGVFVLSVVVCFLHKALSLLLLFTLIDFKIRILSQVSSYIYVTYHYQY